MILRTALLLTAVTVLSAVGCSSSDDATPAPATGPVGGPVSGPENDRCVGEPVGVSDPAACLVPGGDEDAAGGAPGEDEGAGGAPSTDCNLTHDDEYGDTLYNSAGDDDDCKYLVSWTSTPIRKGESVTFTVTATSKASGEPLERIPDQKADEVALSRVEPYLPCDPTHFPPAIDAKAAIKEASPGVFTVGPLVFDESGRWVVRFHFYEECVDSETSPHGHAAFFVDVP
ncbi:MAG: hypothetical protein ABUL62_03695 [Myxococcales bacterium]